MILTSLTTTGVLIRGALGMTGLVTWMAARELDRRGFVISMWEKASKGFEVHEPRGSEHDW